jgi:hypothetical protein
MEIPIRAQFIGVVSLSPFWIGEKSADSLRHRRLRVALQDVSNKQRIALDQGE